MKVAILAGGLGTRLSEETTIRPKPMVEIGPEPIIWHIMKLYSFYGFNDFIICAGYKQNIIKEYFSKYALNHGDIEVNLETQKVKIIKPPKEDRDSRILEKERENSRLKDVIAGITAENLEIKKKIGEHLQRRVQR